MSQKRSHTINDTFRVAPHRLIEADHQWFVFQVDACGIFEVPPELGKWLQHSGSGDTVVPAQAMQQGAWGTECDPELWRQLVRSRILLPAEAEIQGLQPVRNPAPGSLNTLVLQVTDQCNLACDYCYRHQPSGGGVITRPAMSVEVARQAIDFLMAQSESAEKIVVVFFGGEPLLNRSLIAQVIDYTRRCCDHSGQLAEFALTTNGTLFSRSCIRFIREHNIGVTVSMDGDEAAQNRYRRFADGTRTYEQVANGVCALIAAQGVKPPVARVTLGRETVGDAEAILDHLFGLGFAEVGLAPVTTDDPELQLQPQQMQLLLEHFRGLAHRFLEMAGQDRFLGFSNLIDLLVNLHQGEWKRLPCGAGLGLLAADTQGQLFPCQRLTDEASLCMGSVSDGIDQSRRDAFYRQVYDHRHIPCGSCWARHFCAGGCYHEALVRQGNPAAPNIHYCNWIKQWTEIGLDVYAKLAVRRSDILDKLAMLRGNAPHGFIASQQARKETS